MDNIVKDAHAHIRTGKTKSQDWMREILGQGPDKTLKRGFTITSNTTTGATITKSTQIAPNLPITIQFSDGTIEAISKDKTA